METRTPGRSRRPTIRAQLTRIVLIPSISFLVLWTVMTATGFVQAAELMLSVAQGREGIAAFTRLAHDLREERRLTQVRLGDPGDGQVHADLTAQRRRTDESAEAAADIAPTLGPGADDETARTVREFLADRDRLGAARADVDSGRADRAAALAAYTDLVVLTADISSALLRPMEEGDSVSEAVLARRLITVHEQHARADALLSGAIAAGGMNYEETAHFTYLTAAYRDTLPAVAGELRGLPRERHDAMVGSAAWRDTEDMSRRVVTRPPVAPADTPGAPAAWNSAIGVDAADWDRAARPAGTALGRVLDAQVDRAADTAWNSALSRIGWGAAGSVLTLLAGAAAIVAASRSSHRLTARLRALRTEALSLSDTRLPAIVDSARAGRRVDLDAELPRLSYGDDEIGQVADAFTTAQRTAVGAAVKEAEIRKGANRVFLGIAYRNQTLVQRQLSILDEIESDEEDPRALRRLFRLDHLATRARRYADNLIILSGAGSARRWRDPMPVADVLRAAITETEDYERVRLTSAPRARLRGAAVADVVHLVAELVENATQFSPKTCSVDVNCGRVSGGVAVDVEDRGLGMTEDAYAEANRILADPPEFDVMALPEEPRLGLFVVARLAARHGVVVRLRPSPYGGTCATAVVPEHLLDWAAQTPRPAVVRGAPRTEARPLPAESRGER
ncbi:nitrate- and nitrite sensing domain-containing protein [Streptomonospora sp. S1-112]|uniref:histidine kinase n=1 Tax=Streptomonospora mangrovi TaxID=2883123 RepID=A0A9X3NT67_9ACTN|nr:nitrate- and nitrite sensing domain-containing protein [Streptomonospora mangrovi]MDA0567549.1 nitrate- and nitrite sensing domain-containing protein [Streptomonospora mangrovi]